MGDEDHHAALVVEDALEVNVARVLAFPGDAVELAVGAAPDIRALHLVLLPLDVEHAVEDGVLHLQFDGLALGEDALDFADEVRQLGLAPEVVHHEEAAVEEILPHDGNLLVREAQRADLDHVNPRIVEEVRVFDLEQSAERVHLQRGHLLEAVGEVQVRVGEVRAPAATTASAVAVAAAVADAAEGERVLLEPRGVRPHRRLVTVLLGLARGFREAAAGVVALTPEAPAPELGEDGDADEQERGEREEFNAGGHGFFGLLVARAGVSTGASFSNSSCASRKRGASSSAIRMCCFADLASVALKSFARRK